MSESIRFYGGAGNPEYLPPVNKIHVKEVATIRESYAQAGVNIDAANKVKELIGKHARSTHRPEVLGGGEFFGGLFEFKGFKEPVLVSSVDQAGTKTKIAKALDKYDTVDGHLGTNLAAWKATGWLGYAEESLEVLGPLALVMACLLAVVEEPRPAGRNAKAADGPDQGSSRASDSGPPGF